MSTPDPRQLYARAAPRLQAYLRDFLVYMGLLTLFIVIAVAIGSPLAARVSVIAAMASVLLYEPVAISLAGGTIGHLSLNLRIVRASDLGRVSFARALGRTLVKGVLGLWVFLAVYMTARCQGLHDLAAGTVVIPRDPATVPPRGFTVEKPRRRPKAQPSQAPLI